VLNACISPCVCICSPPVYSFPYLGSWASRVYTWLLPSGAMRSSQHRGSHFCPQLPFSSRRIKTPKSVPPTAALKPYFHWGVCIHLKPTSSLGASFPIFPEGLYLCLRLTLLLSQPPSPVMSLLLEACGSFLWTVTFAMVTTASEVRPLSPQMCSTH
jgi:hypothetical protein